MRYKGFCRRSGALSIGGAAAAAVAVAEGQRKRSERFSPTTTRRRGTTKTIYHYTIPLLRSLYIQLPWYIVVSSDTTVDVLPCALHTPESSGRVQSSFELSSLLSSSSYHWRERLFYQFFIVNTINTLGRKLDKRDLTPPSLSSLPPEKRIVVEYFSSL